MDYFKDLQEALKLERQADRQLYQKIIEMSSVADRRADGLTWYPVAIRGTEMSRGDYLTVELERTTHLDNAHQLRFGMPAALFSNHDAKNNRVEGIITHQSGNNLRLLLHTDDLPDWSGDGKLGVDLLFDENSYEEMADALRSAALLAEKGAEGRLTRILIGKESPALPSADSDRRGKEWNGSRHEAIDDFDKAISGLNPSQAAAVDKIVNAKELSIVHGPPGTGKTTTLIRAIKAMIEQDNKQMLVVAPSNTAVDLLAEKLSEEGLNVLRVGNPARVSERLMALTLDAKMAGHKAMKEVRNLKKRANEFRNMAHKYKRNFGKAEREQRKALFDEARKIMQEVNNTEQYVMDDLIGRAQVIAATLVGCQHHTVRKLRFHTAVIDEAGQALEPACWIPVLKAEKLVMAGDHFQLPPTIKSKEAERKGLGLTLLEKSIALHPGSVSLLEEQYRMHETIMGYSSRVFYEDRLKAHASVAGRVLFPGDAPLSFVDTAGCGFEEKLDGTSSTNPEEAEFVFKHVKGLVARLKTHYSDNAFPGIAVISPYKQQLVLLKEQLLQSPELAPYLGKIAVNTIDSFQGQERDIVYISMTRSNTEGEIGFLADIRRMNVAMTRARKKLVVVGDSATLCQFPFYRDFVAYAGHCDAYQSAWEFAID